MQVDESRRDDQRRDVDDLGARADLERADGDDPVAAKAQRRPAAAGAAAVDQGSAAQHHIGDDGHWSGRLRGLLAARRPRSAKSRRPAARVRSLRSSDPHVRARDPLHQRDSPEPGPLGPGVCNRIQSKDDTAADGRPSRVRLECLANTAARLGETKCRTNRLIDERPWGGLLSPGPPRGAWRRFRARAAAGPNSAAETVGHRPAERADRHDQAGDLQPVRRAHRRRHLRRHLGRPRFQGRQYRRHPAPAGRARQAARARSSCAGRAAASPTSITGATASARASKRPRRFGRWREETESNQFGTHEFIRFCRLCGVEPYFAANVGTGSPEEFQQWVEYCNAPAGSTSLADERAANGAARAVRRPLLGRRQRELGLRRQVHPRRLLPRVPPVHRMAAPVRRAALPDRRRPQRQRPRLDPPVLRQVARRPARSDPGLGAALLLRHDRPRPPVQPGPVVRAASQGQPDGDADHAINGRPWANSTPSTRSSW